MSNGYNPREVAEAHRMIDEHEARRRLDHEGLARGVLSASFPPPMPTGREPLPHDRMAPAHRPLPAVSPDCAAGKCRPCAGAAMDDETDEIVACQHECHH